MAYQKPQAIIHQQFEVLPKITEDEMRAVIVGPSAILHRYADADEKIDIYVGVYNPFEDVIYQYPGIKAGGIVDTAYSKLYVDNALLSYFDSSVDRTTHLVAADTVEISDEDVTIYIKSGGAGSTINSDSASVATATDFKKVYTQKVNEEGKPLYVTEKDGVFGETADPSDSDIYEYSEGSGPVKVYVELTDGSGARAYQDKNGTVTYSTLFADTYAASAKKQVLVVSSETAERKKYRFYNDYNAENVILSDNFNFQDAIAPRAAELGIRDVAIGDYVEVSGTYTDSNDECVSLGTFVSRIIGFTDIESVPYVENLSIVQPNDTTAVAASLSETIGSTTTTDASNTYAVIKSDGGTIDCIKYGFVVSNVSTSADYKQVGCTFSITADKLLEEGNCTGTLWFKIKSDSTGENRTIQIKPTTTEFTLSDYGTVKIELKSGAFDGIVEKIKAGVGVEWKYTVKQAYVKSDEDTDIVIGGTDNYIGPDDTYILTCTEGCLTPAAAAGTTPAQGAKFSVVTVNGRENLKNVTFTPEYWTEAQDLGTQGLTIKLNARTGNYKGITAGTQIVFDVISAKPYRVNGVKLADDLPENMLSNKTKTTQLDVKLLYKDNIELPETSPVNGTTNWEQETSSFTVFENASTVNPDFSVIVYNEDGTVAASSYIPLYLIGYGNDHETLYTNFSKIYFNYREWSPVHASNCSLCESVSALDNIIGPLDMDNPLKWAVYKALLNSDGASVGYVAVKDPKDLDDWQAAFNILEGRDDVYTVVPLTTDVMIQNLAVTLVNAESAAEACRWKTALFNMELPTEGMVIGKSTNSTKPTSSDGKQVECKITANTLNASSSFTKVTCVSGNARFIDYGVKSGDELRIVDSQGSIVSTHIVDQVYSNGTLTIVEPTEFEQQKAIVEVWHTYTRDEEVELIRDRAQSFASRRIGLVWPDIVSEGGVEEPGYYLSAALAGLKSGVEPQQGLTRRTIQGFDGFTRSKPRYTESQLDLMASSGVWICVEDSDGTPQSRHALTTSTINTFYSEEMMTRNFDSVSKYMYQVIDTYIGVYNVTNETLRSIYYNLRNACEYLIGKGQMTDYTNITVKQHDLLLDRVVAYIDCGLPFAVNNVELYITAQAYKLDAVTIGNTQE